MYRKVGMVARLQIAANRKKTRADQRMDLEKLEETIKNQRK
jgi:hypothetical protein